MPVPTQESRKSKMPSQKAEEVEKNLAKLEEETNQELQKEPSKPEGEGGTETPKSDSAPDKETSPKDEKPKEQKPAGQPADEPEEDLNEEEVQQLSAKAQKRFRKMAQTIKELKEKGQKVETPKTDVPIEEPVVDDLEDFSDVEEPETPKVDKETKPKKKLPWESDEKPDDDGGEKVLTEEEIEEKTRKISQEETQKTLRAEKEQKYNRAIVNRLSSDVKLIESTYDILNPKPDMTGTKETNKNYGKPTNPNYRQDIAKTLTETYKRLFKADKRVRLLTFVQQQMGLIEQGKKLGKEEVETTVNKQDAEQPLTPSGGAPRKNNAMDAINKATTIEELEAAEKLL